MREAVVENEFVKAVQKAGGVAYKLTSQTTNGLRTGWCCSSRQRRCSWS